jgi:hypothetical protein
MDLGLGTKCVSAVEVVEGVQVTKLGTGQELLQVVFKVE